MSISNKHVLFQRFEICQVLRDILTINEATNWNLRASTNAKYRSIGAYIKQLDEDCDEFINIKNQIDSNIKIVNMYTIIRPTESIKFNDSLFNYKLLFHGTKCRNLIGILSRGLLLPNYTVNEIGVTRSDIGMLGNGIYFSDCINTSLKYTDLSRLKNSRMIAVCDVALGNCKDYFEYNFELNEAPKDYHSTHGVSNNSGIESKFIDDEYVIYDISQQKIKYLIELQHGDDGETKIYKNVDECQKDIDESTDEGIEIDINEIDRLEKGRNMLDRQECGLMSQNGQSIPLKSIHIRVQLLDMVSKVNIFQEYENKEDFPIEAKFIFPLDDNAAICGFEAFINDKHVIGICKEKEEAHREYKEAIEKGHGAYLMDQEGSELFKVNIGNLPSNCKCIIKITYVAELDVENENIVFRLPNYIAPWQSFSFKNEKLQDSLISKCFDTLVTNSQQITLEMSIQMPFEIRSIYSPTHVIDTKQTACHAVVKLSRKQNLKETFLLYISMSAIHMPRMLVEENSSCLHTRACMLSFYPEFETISKLESPNIVFLIDSSNSMSLNSFKYAKKLLSLMLRKLPTKCFFNIVSFGSIFEELFPFGLKNEKVELDKAVNFINKLKPNSGNTDLLNAIQAYLLISQSELSNFVLITDGHINEPESLLSTLNKVSKQNRFFTCAVGANSNKHLLKMISNATNGSFEQFDSQFQSKWKDKVEDIIDRLSQPPAIGNISVNWETYNNFVDNFQAPSKISSLFNGRRQVVYGFVPNCLLATLKANLDGQEVSTVVNCPELMITKGTIIHKLTAKALINDWQYGILSDDQFNNELIKTKLKSKIIELSKGYSISSEYTSFIAIEERDEAEKEAVSTTPSIENLLAKDVDASAIDILSYMNYTNDEPNGENFEDVLNQIYENYDKMDNDEKNEFSEVLVGGKEKIIEKYQPTHPTRLKFGHLLMKDYRRRRLLKQAADFAKETFDEGIAELDSLSEET